MKRVNGSRLGSRWLLSRRLWPVLCATALVSACTTERIIVVREPAAAPKPGEPATVASGEEPSEPAPVPTTSGANWGILPPDDRQSYEEVVRKVANMVSDYDLQRRVGARALSLVNVAWEDTGRYEGSSVGPNISDVTLQVRQRMRGGDYDEALMPVIRHPNFEDRTGDVPADRFFVRVGNEQGRGLSTVPLTDVLRNIRAYAAKPDSIRGSGNLLAPRDTHFLVSAQAVFLPIPKTGQAEFNPVVFNYQSSPGAPAVLTILVTRQGTSMQVIENRADDTTAAGWGQELYFDNRGQRAAFTAERKSDVEQRIAAQGGPKTEDDRSALQQGADVMFLIQVPLKRPQVRRWPKPPMMMPMAKGAAEAGMGAAAPSSAAYDEAPAKRERSDVEQAVLAHGPNLGPYSEGRYLTIERDPTFPIRITVQFYKATSNGVASDVDLDSIARSIGSVYEHAEYVGSLVVPNGDPRRPTAWQNVPRAWFPW